MLVIRVTDCRENLIKLVDALNLLGYSSTTDILSTLQEKYKDESEDLFGLSDTYLGAKNEVRYVRCKREGDSKSFKVYNGYVSKDGDVRVDVESIFMALRVRSSHDDYRNLLEELIGSTNVPVEVENYMRVPRAQLMYYIGSDVGMSMYRFYDFEAEGHNKRKTYGVELQKLTSEIYEEYCKKIEKRAKADSVK